MVVGIVVKEHMLIIVFTGNSIGAVMVIFGLEIVNDDSKILILGCSPQMRILRCWGKVAVSTIKLFS